jgi:hypothetical protein
VILAGSLIIGGFVPAINGRIRRLFTCGGKSCLLSFGQLVPFSIKTPVHGVAISPAVSAETIALRLLVVESGSFTVSLARIIRIVVIVS